MAVKLIITITDKSEEGINFNAEVNDAEKHSELEEELAQCLLAACLKEMGRIQNKSHQEDE